MLIKNKKLNILDFFICLIAIIQICLYLFDLADPSDNINYILYICNYVLIISIILNLVIKGIALHFIALAFFGCYLLFLMGQKPFEPEYDVYLTFVWLKLSTEQYIIFSGILFIGIAITYFSYMFFYAKAEDKVCKKTQKRRANNIKPLVKAMFWITLPCAIYMQLKVVIVRSVMVYTSGYLINVDIPGVIKIGYYIFSTVILLYMAMRPTKKEMFMLCFFSLFLEGGVQLFQGRRALFAGTLLFIVWYLFKYYNIEKIDIKYIFRLGSIVLGMIILFYIVEQARSGNEAGGLSFNLFKRFFISTGGSDSVIANTVYRKADFPQKGIIYLLEPLLENPIITKILGKHATGQGIEYLEQFNSFSHWISYLTEPSLYLSGHGMGSCYLAETYLAFGMVGVVIVSSVIGKLLWWLNSLELNENIFKITFVFFLVKRIFTLPRDGLFSWFSSIPYMIFTFMLVYPFYSKYCKNGKIK